LLGRGIRCWGVGRCISTCQDHQLRLLGL
jgi:hypothetical protein